MVNLGGCRPIFGDIRRKNAIVNNMYDLFNSVPITNIVHF